MQGKMTKEDIVQIALGLKFECRRCEKIFGKLDDKPNSCPHSICSNCCYVSYCGPCEREYGV